MPHFSIQKTREFLHFAVLSSSFIYGSICVSTYIIIDWYSFSWGKKKKKRICNFWKKGQDTQKEYNNVNSKSKAKEKLLSFLNEAGNIITEEKAGVINAFFTSVFYRQASYPQATQPSKMEDSDGEVNQPPQFRRKQLMAFYCT